MIQHLRNRPVRGRPNEGDSSPQGGFVLIVTLAVMMVSMIIVTALLTLTVDTQRIEDTGRVREHQIRAAEAGLNVAINQVRNSAAIAAPVPWAPGLPAAVNDPARMGECEPIDGMLDIDGVPVTVHCNNQGSWPLPPEFEDWIPADNGGPALRLVGDPYTRTWVDKNDMPWSSALPSGQYNSAEVANSDASLVHTGAAPLRIVGGLEARGQVVALRSPLTATLAGPAPPRVETPEAFGEAIEVTGYAHQGGPPLFASGTPGGGCGVASPANVWGVQSSMVTSTSDIDTSTSGFACNNEGLASGAGGGVLFPGSGDWRHIDTVIARRTLPPPGSPCPRVNGVVQLDAGAYDAAATATLNGWFTGGCENTTFWFVPGDYWFDVWDPGNPDPDQRSTLRFADYTSEWVFGAPIGSPVWTGAGRAPKAAFPRVCDQNQMGANIVLSSRTGVWHDSGRVAICGPRPPVNANNQNQPVHGTAIWQRTSAPLGNVLHGTAPNVASGWSVIPAGDFATHLQAINGRRVRASQPIPGFVLPPFVGGCWVSGGCTFDRTFTLTGFTNLGRPDPGPAPISNASIDLTGNARLSNASGSHVRFDISLAGGGSCWRQYPDLPTNFVTRSYNLFAGGTGTCSNAIINDRAQLAGASVQVTVRMRNPAWSRFLWFGANEIYYEIDNVRLRTGWSPTVASVTTDNPGSDPSVGLTPFDNPERAQVPGPSDGGVATVRNSCTNPTWPLIGSIFCTGVEWYESAINFQGFSDDTLLDGFQPLNSVDVSLFFRSVNALWGSGPPNTRLVLEITNREGATCAQDAPLATLQQNFGQGVGNFLTTPLTFSLVTGVDAGPCGAVLRTPRDLLREPGDPADRPNLRLLLRASNECYLTCQFGWDVDGVVLQATTVGYDRPATPFRVRWNPFVTGQSGNPGEDGDATFNVVGSTSISMNDVEVDFDGDGRPRAQPIFVGGNNNPGLVAGSLATRATTGNWPDWSTHNPTDPNPATRVDLADRLPDPVASNGATRPPARRVLLTACVIENPDDPVGQHRLVRRAAAEVDILDSGAGGALVPGREVRIRRWAVNLPGGPVAVGAAASTTPCPVLTAWPA